MILDLLSAFSSNTSPLLSELSVPAPNTTMDSELNPTTTLSNGMPADGVVNYNAIEQPQFKVYHRRWFVLAVVCLLNFSNAMVRNRI